MLDGKEIRNRDDMQWTARCLCCHLLAVVELFWLAAPCSGCSLCFTWYFLGNLCIMAGNIPNL
jgi:hypothetical protein